MPAHNTHYYRIDPLYFWEIGVLAGLAGVITSKFPTEGWFILGAILYATCLFAPKHFNSAHNKYLSLFCKSFLLILTFIAALFWTNYQTPHLKTEHSALATFIQTEKNITTTGIVDEVTFLPNNRIRFFLTDVLIEASHPDFLSSSSLKRINNRIVVTWQAPTVVPITGQRFYGKLNIKPITALYNPDLWNTKEYWHKQQVFWRAFAINTQKEQVDFTFTDTGNYFAHLRQAWVNKVVTALAPANQVLSPAQATIPALVFGDRRFFNSPTLQLFANATLLHGLALSGLHLGFALLLGIGLSKLCGRCFPRLYLSLSQKRLNLYFGIIFASLYLWIGGAALSLLRAWCMLIITCIYFFWAKPKTVLDIFFVTLAAFIIFDPHAFFDIRLQLSLGAILAIILSLPLLKLIQDWFTLRFPATDAPLLSRLCRKLGFYCFSLFFISTCIQFIHAPLTSWTFGTQSFWSILNIIWIPLLFILLLPLALFAAFLTLIAPATLSYLEPVLSFPMNSIIFALSFLEKNNVLFPIQVIRPIFYQSFGYGLLIVGLLTLFNKLALVKRENEHQFSLSQNTPWKAPSKALALWLAVACFFCLAPRILQEVQTLSPAVTVRIIDVGQGQAVLVEHNGKRVLIDAGGVKTRSFNVGQQVLAPSLSTNTPPRLFTLMLTHADTDHIAGAEYLLKNFTIAAWGSSAINNTDKRLLALQANASQVNALRAPPTSWQAGDILELSSAVKLHILHPPKNDTEFTGNNSSLVVLLTQNGQPLILLTGDIEASAITRLLNEQTTLAAQVLLLPHHGSRSSISTEFYAAVNPILALSSSGENHADFPHPEVTAMLQSLDIPLFGTHEYGQLSIVWNNNQATLYGADKTSPTIENTVLWTW